MQATDTPADEQSREAQIPDPERVSILVVDDLPEKLLAYEIILEELGQNLVTASSGEEALKLVLAQEFAVILLDVNMPGIDGFETAALIRQRKRSSRTPIIFLTAFTDEIRMAQGYASGAVDYLPTPVVPEILRAKVRVFIELSQMRRQAASQAEERAKRAAAEEADQRKNEFLAMLAHELRNPLAPIRNALNILKLEPERELQRQMRDTIERQLNHMIHLVDDLMDVSRITKGKIELRKEKILLEKALTHAIETAEPLIKQHNHVLKATIPEQPVWLEADYSRIAQIFSNLLNNAAKYTDDGGVIELEVHVLDDRARIIVRDNGIGIPPAMRSRIFDIFSQADSTLERRQGGLGIGLTLVKKLVELHNGEIEVRSEGRGSEFIVTLPTVAMPKSITAPAEAEQKSQTASIPVLVVDDNVDSAKTLGWMIEFAGHDYRLAHDGASAIEIAKTYRPKVILLDIGLPNMNGYEVCKTLREQPELEHTIFIAQTGWGQAEHLRRSKEAGFDHHFVKPVNMEALKQVINSLMQ